MNSRLRGELVREFPIPPLFPGRLAGWRWFQPALLSSSGLFLLRTFLFRSPRLYFFSCPSTTSPLTLSPNHFIHLQTTFQSTQGTYLACRGVRKGVLRKPRALPSETASPPAGCCVEAAGAALPQPTFGSPPAIKFFLFSRGFGAKYIFFFFRAPCPFVSFPPYQLSFLHLSFLRFLSPRFFFLVCWLPATSATWENSVLAAAGSLASLG